MDTQENYVDSAVDRIVNLWNTCKLEESDYSLIRFCVSEYQEYPIVNIRRSFADDKWTLSVRWSDEAYGEKLKERVYAGVKMKTGIMKYHPSFIAQRKMQKELQNKGYNDIFLPNLMVLSPKYAEYKKSLDALNNRICSELGLYYDSNYNLVMKNPRE